jgi:hypothetical protein
MKYSINRKSTIFLRGAVLLIGVIVLALCLFALPAGLMSDNTGDYRPILLGMYLPAIPFFIGLYQALKLLHLIDKGEAFSLAAVGALKYIKYCAAIIGALYAAGTPYIFTLADRDDAPGVALLGLIFTFAPFIAAVFAAVLQQQLKKAIDIKSENDLTV